MRNRRENQIQIQWILFWVIGVAIFYFGVHKILLLIAPFDFIENTNNRYYYLELVLFLGFVTASFGLQYILRFRKELAELKKIIVLLRFNYRDLSFNLDLNYKKDCNRDIPLILALKIEKNFLRLNKEERKKEICKTFVLSQYFEHQKYYSVSGPIELANKILSETIDNYIYLETKNLETILLNNLPNVIKDEFPEKVHAMKVNFLEAYLNSYWTEKGLIIEEESLTPLNDFYKKVMNEFHNSQKYQLKNFSESDLINFFRNEF
jgi:hypothetical protein